MTKPIGDPTLDAEAMRIIEAAHADQREPLLEAELSINEWVERIKAAAISAHHHCRSGDTKAETDAWAAIGAAALSRIATILHRTQEEE